MIHVIYLNITFLHGQKCIFVIFIWVAIPYFLLYIQILLETVDHFILSYIFFTPFCSL